MPKKITKDALASVTTFRKGSSNVFADMGLANPAELSVKAGLAREINSLLDERGLTQAQAANLLQIHQPQISLLRHGRLTDFSLERLLRFLSILDVSIEVRLHRNPPGRTRATRAKGKTEKPAAAAVSTARPKAPRPTITLSASR